MLSIILGNSDYNLAENSSRECMLIYQERTMGNEVFTIGRYLSQSYLLKYGVSAEKLAHYEYLDRHESRVR